ncbi:hypothetical protein [Corynebacterium sp.]|uniref:hypothetical protein n=1 Tax=Corynebacterium sp. TaxID=1720 RepID=UPI0028AA4366|nr:hypothetical protein [Corynebacterium sp.]
MTNGETPQNVKIGQYWAYRESDKYICESHKVHIKGIEPFGKKSQRYVIEFRDGRTRKVPRNRLKAPWEESRNIDEDLNLHINLKNQGGDEVENSIATSIIEEFMPLEVIDIHVDDTCIIFDPAALEEILEIRLEELLEGIITRSLPNGLEISPLGAAKISQRYALLHPEKLLSSVAREEKEYKYKLKEHQGILSARSEWQFYLSYVRPRHELIREWCGHKATFAHERLAAAEAEVVRLRNFALRLIDTIEEHRETVGKQYREELYSDEITPYNIRETPDRPLEPHEIPERVEYRRAWWH